MTLLSLLRAATRDAHASIERHVPLLSHVVSQGDYRWYLQALLGFYVPVEGALSDLGAGFSAEVSLPQRLKSAALRHDLAELGQGDLAPVCSHVPRIAGASHGYGVMYVLEGSTLGGQVLAKHLTNVLDIQRCSSFLHAYGREVAPMWKSFGDALSAHEASQRCDQDAVLSAARETFERLEAWLVQTRAVR